MSFVRCGLAVLLWAVPTLVMAAPPRPRVVLVESQATSVPTGARGQVRMHVLEELKAIHVSDDRVVVTDPVSYTEVPPRLRPCHQPACFQEIGRVMGADFILWTHVVYQDRSYNYIFEVWSAQTGELLYAKEHGEALVSLPELNIAARAGVRAVWAGAERKLASQTEPPKGTRATAPSQGTAAAPNDEAPKAAPSGALPSTDGDNNAAPSSVPSWRRPVAFAAMGAGAALMVGGGTMVFLHGRDTDCSDLAVGKTCFGTLNSNVRGLLVGGVGLLAAGTGVALWLGSRQEKDPGPATTTVSNLSLGLTPSGLQLAGEF